MDIVISTVASVAATIITVLGAIYYLDRKIDANRRELTDLIKGTRSELEGKMEANRLGLEGKMEANRLGLEDKIEATRLGLEDKMEANRREHSAEIKEVRQASEAAHVAIRADLTDIKVQLAAHNERLKCIESHLQVNRPED